MDEIHKQIDQYINFLIVEKGLADATIDSYSGDLKRFVTFLKSCKINHVEKTDTTVILKYLIYLRDEGLTARSRARHLVTLRGFFKFLIQEKILSLFSLQAAQREWKLAGIL